jgi:uncharacterized membrane protein
MNQPNSEDGRWSRANLLRLYINGLIVLVIGPSESVQSVGVITARFPATATHPEMASVYCVATPRGSDGFMRFVKVADLQLTSWTLKICRFSISRSDPSIRINC